MGNILIHNFKSLLYGALLLPMLSACNNINFPTLENTPRLPDDWDVQQADDTRPRITIDDAPKNETGAD